MRIFVLISFCVFITGCSTHYGAAKIVSLPAGAEVISDSDGTVLGVTPTTVWWQDSSGNRKQPILRIKKDGYYEKVSSFWLSMRHKNLEDARNNPQLVEVVLQKRGE